MRKEIASVMWANRWRKQQNAYMLLLLLLCCVYDCTTLCLFVTVYAYECALAFVFVRQLFSYWWGLIVCRLTMHELSVSFSLSLCLSIQRALAISFQYNLIFWSSQIVSIVSNFLLERTKKLSERERARTARTHSTQQIQSAWMSALLLLENKKTHVNWNE